MVSARASSPFASDHRSMRFVSAVVARSFVGDVPARVVCFLLIDDRPAGLGCGRNSISDQLALNRRGSASLIGGKFP
jgi:hypothetical protein